jgi:arylsulfatase A-like enzyme
MPGSTSAPFASEAFRGKSRNGPWGDSIEELDWSTGEILGKLKELNLETQTLVIWTSDNGAPLARPSGDLSRGSNLPLHGRGYTTSEGAFRVPTIFWWPTKIQAHTICDQLASTMDLLPTFAELASVEPPSNKIDGLSITQLLFDQKAVTPHDAYYYYDRDQLQAVRSGPWKLFLPLSDFNRHPHFEKGGSAQALLFNLDEDIDCSSNLASSYPKVVGRLMKMAEEAKWELGDRGVEGHEARQRGQIANPKPLRLKAR